MVILLLLSLLLFPTTASAKTNHIVISEIQIYGETAKDEFIRLYNPTANTINISGWKLKKKTSSGSESNLVSNFVDGTTIPANSGFLITHKTDYKGNETADYTYSGASYSVASNNTILLYNNEGNLIDKVGFGEANDFESAPAKNPENGKSIIRNNNQDTDNNKNDFFSNISTLEGNQITSPSNPPLQQKRSTVQFGDIVINRVMPNPIEGKEWIEIYNTKNTSINLNGWTINDGVGIIYNLSDNIDDYIIIEINNRLNNAGDTISIADQTNKTIDVITYGNWNDGNLDDNLPEPKKGEILSREKIINTEIHEIPASAKMTEEEKGMIEEENVIARNEAMWQSQKYNTNISSIQISEFIPNPKGNDTEGEWIELYNSSTSTNINIGGFYLDDNDGGSKPYKIPENTIIKADNYIFFNRKTTKLALNNNYDAVRLLDQNQEEILNIEYEDAKDGSSYAFINKKWQWTSTPSPLKQNKLSTLLPIYKGDLKAVSKTSNSATGIVIVPPNIFSTQIMYIDGMQLYMHNTNWPILNIGDKISVWGTPSTYYNEPRLKLKNKNSIQIISHNNELVPEKITGDDINNDFIGHYIIIEGEVLEIQSKKIFIDVDGVELEVYKKTGIEFPKLEEGDFIKILGVLSIYKDKFRLLPRGVKDFKKLQTQTIKAKKDFDNKSFPWHYLGSTLLFTSLVAGTIIKRRRKNDRTRTTDDSESLG